MKSAKAVFRCAAFLCGLALAIPMARSAGDKTFEGEIADSQCALGVHSLHQSHDEMIAMGKAGKTAADCTRFCVKERGGRFVLQTKHEVYRLDDQDLPEKYAGMKVRVTGTLDPKTNIIQVHAIDPLPEK